MLALVVGSLLAVAGLAFVLWPLLRGTPEAGHAPAFPLAPEAAPEASAIEALREIEFDQATGKISAEDYAALRASYTPRALEELRARDAASAAEASAIAAGAPSATGAGALDAAEQLVARAKQRVGAPGTAGAAGGPASCPQHGARPEPDAVFCSDCGRFLGATCRSCGARVEGDRARFCTECGAALAA